jgi:hypothetical protein
MISNRETKRQNRITHQVPKALPAHVYPLVPPHDASGLTLPVPAVQVPKADWQPAPQ